MNTQEILDQIERKLQDSSYARDTELLPALNNALLMVAFQHPLPALQVTETVDSVLEQDFVSMPSDYHTRLLFVQNKTTERNCRICYTRQTLRRMYEPELQEKGDIEDVALEGRTLYYRRIPETVQTLQLTYYTQPDALTDATDSTPDCLPESLHFQILGNYVLYQLFSEIEDGMEGQKINTEFYMSQYMTGMQMLNTYWPDVSRPRRYFSRRIKTY